MDLPSVLDIMVPYSNVKGKKIWLQHIVIGQELITLFDIVLEKKMSFSKRTRNIYCNEGAESSEIFKLATQPSSQPKLNIPASCLAFQSDLRAVNHHGILIFN